MNSTVQTAERLPVGSAASGIVIAITPGEPAGIGPDLCAMIAQHMLNEHIVIIADRELLRQRARDLNLPLEIVDYHHDLHPHHTKAALPVLHVPLAAAARPGKLDPANSAYVLRTLELATEGCLAGKFDAMVTGPVHKGVINDAGFSFTGHTEFLAARTSTPRVVMMLTGGGLRIALATTHLALKDVPRHITRDSLEQTIRVVRRDLIVRFAIPRPRIGVAGLNPHAGESGYLGLEELEVIIPVLKHLRGLGFDLEGPLPADTLFTTDRLRNYDCALAMYHDQGLPVLKYASFGASINVTLGLPIIRTSVDHGTALDLAGTGRAKIGSLILAIKLASELAASAKSVVPAS